MYEGHLHAQYCGFGSQILTLGSSSSSSNGKMYCIAGLNCPLAFFTIIWSTVHTHGEWAVLKTFHNCAYPVSLFYPTDICEHFLLF